LREEGWVSVKKAGLAISSPSDPSENAGSAISSPTGPSDLPASELSQLTMKAVIERYGVLKCDIYNGTHFDLNSIEVEVSVYRSEKLEFTHVYALSRIYPTSPKTVGNFEAPLEFKLDETEYWTGKVIRATGTRKS